jgi:hypothetical protein
MNHALNVSFKHRIVATSFISCNEIYLLQNQQFAYAIYRHIYKMMQYFFLLQMYHILSGFKYWCYSPKMVVIAETCWRNYRIIIYTFVGAKCCFYNRRIIASNPLNFTLHKISGVVRQFRQATLKKGSARWRSG